jgi:yersiniabactin salicyl-AMP ligase
MYKKDYTIYEGLKYWEKKTIGKHLSEWAEKYSERTACSDQERSITYNELYQRAPGIASGLAENGISKGL